MHNIGGPESDKRRVLYGAAQSILLYGAPVWYKMVERIPAYKEILAKSQRRGLIRVATSYRTVSGEALQVITGTPPIDLLAKERMILHENGQGLSQQARKTVREETIGVWQARWDDLEHKAQWTKRLIPIIKKWLDCKHRTIDFRVTQVLTGHGSFKEFTKKIKKSPNNECLYCGTPDTVEDTIFECPRWRIPREKADTKLNTKLNTNNMVDQMILTRTRYETIRKFLNTVMEIKEEEERAKERGELIF